MVEWNFLISLPTQWWNFTIGFRDVNECGHLPTGCDDGCCRKAIFATFPATYERVLVRDVFFSGGGWGTIIWKVTVKTSGFLTSTYVPSDHICTRYSLLPPRGSKVYSKWIWREKTSACPVYRHNVYVHRDFKYCVFSFCFRNVSIYIYYISRHRPSGGSGRPRQCQTHRIPRDNRFPNIVITFI